MFFGGAVMSRNIFVLLLAVCGLAACGNTVPVAAAGSACELSFQCPAGFICKEHRCSEVVIDAGSSTGGGDGTTGGGGGTTTGGGTGGGSGDDAGSPDAGVDAGVRLAFAPGAYRRCHDDLECAVFGGNCLIDLALSRPDDGGVDRVKVAQIDPTFAADEGVCTLPCTADPRICDSIVVTGPGGQSASFHCQVVYAGHSPYPAPAPAFPFDATLDSVALARGVPFASICRPPFEASVTHEPSFCQPCTQDMQCGSGACFIERPSVMPASGACVETCTQQSDCQFGFTCGTLPNSANTRTYCLPSAGTCGRCRDGDGDLRGVGRCGPLDEPVTAVDCDDANPVAYFDSANPAHAFPGVCGPADVNCNGKSDDVEQLGSENHCGACGDTCVPRQGELANSVRQCVARTSSMTYACVAACAPGWADCDGDVSTGCETPLSGNVVWAEDADGDGRGNPSNFIYACAGTTPPVGWVQNKLDCNDTDGTIYGGDATNPSAPELCDGKDNNCNGLADDTGFIAQEGQRCTTTFPGVCSVGTWACQSRATAQAALNCVPNLDPAARASVAESCNGLDDNCNGQTDEDLDYYESQGQQNPAGHGAPVTCTVASAVGICRQGTYACATQTNALIDGGTRVVGVWQCNGTPPASTDPIDDNAIDANCDGTDGDLSNAIFVRPVAGGGTLDGNDAHDGTAQHPVATLQHALSLACATSPCKDIYLEAQTFTSSEPTTIPVKTGVFPVRIYGGFGVSLTCNPSCSLAWVRGTSQTVLERNSPANDGSSDPFTRGYAAIEGATGGAMSLLLDQVHVITRRPDVSQLLSGGQSAPDQIGIRCPVNGCRELSVRNVDIEVEAAMPGGAGNAAASSGITSNGPNGCDTNTNCSGIQVSDWMQYSAESDRDHDALWGPGPSSCPDSQSPRGGSSGAIRWQPPGGGNRGYNFSGVSGEYGWGAGGSGGMCVSIRGQSNPSANGTFTWPATRGGDGIGGVGALWQTWSFGVSTSGGYPVTSRPASARTATYGRTGGGGGGGAGCIHHPDYFDCPCGEYRGGGGGGGGCGGYAGNNGGHGGSSIGLLLTATNNSPDLNVLMSGNFSLRLGAGGAGGKGTAGGDGRGGGWGGTAGNHSYLNGGNGGNGGGGGGGAGGAGGSSIGILRWCQRSSSANNCGMTVPAIIEAAPANYINIGAAGLHGVKGSGGLAGAKMPNGTGTESASTNAGGDGIDGYDGISGTLVAR